MERIDQNIVFKHMLIGNMALLAESISILSREWMRLHRKAESIYFWAMTLGFISGIIVAGYRNNHFLLLISFLSYYSISSGVRFLKLKNLHKNQTPKWCGWITGITNGVANIIFIGMGMYYLFRDNSNLPSALLYIGVGIGCSLNSYNNLKPLILRPSQLYYWSLAHNSNMMGGHITSLTALLSTMVNRFELINPLIAFVLPSLIDIPLLPYWQHQIENSK